MQNPSKEIDFSEKVHYKKSIPYTDGSREDKFISSTSVLKSNFIDKLLIGLCDDDFFNYFKAVLGITGWIRVPASQENYLENLELIDLLPHQRQIYDLLIQSHIDFNFIKKFFKVRLDKWEEFEDIYSSMLCQDCINLLDYIPQKLTKIIDDPNLVRETQKLINTLWDVKPAIGGTNIGKGEVCLTIICGGQKSEIGDLKLPLSECQIELKGTNGRLGISGEHFVDYTPNRLANLVNLSKTEFRGKIYLKMELTKLSDYEQKAHEEYSEKRISVVRSVRKQLYQIQEREAKRYKLGKKLLKKDRTALDNIRAVNRFLKNVGVEPLPKECTGTGISIATLRKVKSLYDTWHQYKSRDLSLIIVPERKKFTFDQAVKGYFLDSTFNSDCFKLVDGFFECRNVEGKREYQEDLKNSLYQFFQHYPVQFLREKQTLERLMITLHAYCYWLHSDFTHLQIVNDETKSCCILKFPNEKQPSVQAFEHLFLQVPDKLRTSFSVGQQSPTGIEIKLEK